LVPCAIKQYSQFEALDGVYINGNLAQGENITDMGGAKFSYLALQNLLGDVNITDPSIVPGNERRREEKRERSEREKRRAERREERRERREVIPLLSPLLFYFSHNKL
jgi:Peptidase family M13